MSNRLNIYPTPPQVEHKALADCRRAAIKAALPRSKIRKPSFGRTSEPLLRGYVYAEARPADTPYMRARAIGSVSRGDLSKLWAHCRIRTPARPENPYKAGDQVIIAKGAFAEVKAKVIETRQRSCIVAFDLLGKTHQQAMSYVQLRPG